MNNLRALSVLNGPHTSEKSTMVADKNRQIVFNVRTDATKLEVKRSVEKMFNVKVSDVTVLNVKGKRKRFAQRTGKRSNWKKAYVSLADGHDIDFSVAE